MDTKQRGDTFTVKMLPSGFSYRNGGNDCFSGSLRFTCAGKNAPSPQTDPAAAAATATSTARSMYAPFFPMILLYVSPRRMQGASALCGEEKTVIIFV